MGFIVRLSTVQRHTIPSNVLLTKSSISDMILVMRICKYDGCNNKHAALGWCMNHYKMVKRHGSPEPMVRKVPDATEGQVECSINDCHRAVRYNNLGWCEKHYGRWKRNGDPNKSNARKRNICSIDDCEETCHAYEMCTKHFRRFKVHGDPHYVTPPKYKIGDKKYTFGGYVEVKFPDAPNARPGKGGWVLEHIYVMSQSLGRRIETENGENIHHKNGKKDDNRLENLELWVSKQPAGQRPEDLLKWAYEIIDRYGCIYGQEAA